MIVIHDLPAFVKTPFPSPRPALLCIFLLFSRLASYGSPQLPQTSVNFANKRLTVEFPCTCSPPQAFMHLAALPPARQYGHDCLTRLPSLPSPLPSLSLTCACTQCACTQFSCTQGNGDAVYALVAHCVVDVDMSDDCGRNCHFHPASRGR